MVLANYEERLKEARKMVWRDRGEPAVEVGDLWECLEHGTRGGLSTSSFLLSGCAFGRFVDGYINIGAATLAFAIRSGINFFILMARIKNFPRYVLG